MSKPWALPVLLILLATIAMAAPARDLKISADRLDYDENKLKIRLLGHVRIVSEDLVMTSPYAEYFTDTQIGNFEGGVKLTGPGTSAVGREMHVFYGEQRAVLKGSVRLVSEKGLGAESGTPTTMACDELEYFFATEVGKARGRVKVRQGNRRAYGDEAEYRKAEQLIILTGNVRFERGDQDWVMCNRAEMNLAAETVTAVGGVVARTRLEESATPAASPPPTQARPQPIEPDFPVKPIEAEPPLILPGLDQ